MLIQKLLTGAGLNNSHKGDDRVDRDFVPDRQNPTCELIGNRQAERLRESPEIVKLPRSA